MHETFLSAVNNQCLWFVAAFKICIKDIVLLHFVNSCVPWKLYSFIAFNFSKQCLFKALRNRVLFWLKILIEDLR